MRLALAVALVASLALSPAAEAKGAKRRAPLVSVRGPSMLEGTKASTTAVFELSLTTPTRRPVRIRFHTVAGTALPGHDFVAKRGTVTIGPGRRAARIGVAVVADDVHESSRIETFSLHLTPVRNARMATRRVSATVFDDDLPGECHRFAGVGNVWQCAAPLPDGGLGKISNDVLVLLPDAYDHRTPLPVVYLLHGVADSYRTWVDETDVETFAAQEGAIVVMPDGGRGKEAGWYSNWWDGSRQWERFHTEVLVSWIDDHFASAGDGHRAVVGASMGGFGAMAYAGRHPGLFAGAASLSGVLDTQLYGPAQGYAFRLANDTPFGSFGTPTEKVWGDPVLQSDVWTAHNPAALARGPIAGGRAAYDALTGRLWLRSGRGTLSGKPDHTNLDGHIVEHLVWQTNQSFRAATATSARPPAVDYADYDGTHDWNYWEEQLREVLPALVASVRPS